MKLNLNENMVRALARNILFESNERIALYELNMSPEKTGNGNSPVNPNANAKRMDIFKHGPDKNNSEPEEFEETEDFGRDDYGFVLRPDGDLKTFMIPEHLMEDPPEEVLMILRIFGIDSIHDLEDRTLH